MTPAQTSVLMDSLSREMTPSEPPEEPMEFGSVNDLLDLKALADMQ